MQLMVAWLPRFTDLAHYYFRKDNVKKKVYSTANFTEFQYIIAVSVCHTIITAAGLLLCLAQSNSTIGHVKEKKNE